MAIQTRVWTLSSTALTSITITGTSLTLSSIACTGTFGRLSNSSAQRCVYILAVLAWVVPLSSYACQLINRLTSTTPTVQFIGRQLYESAANEMRWFVNAKPTRVFTLSDIAIGSNSIACTGAHSNMTPTAQAVFLSFCKCWISRYAWNDWSILVFLQAQTMILEEALYISMNLTSFFRSELHNNTGNNIIISSFTCKWHTSVIKPSVLVV